MHFDWELLHLAQAAVHFVHQRQVRPILWWIQTTYRLHSWNLQTRREEEQNRLKLKCKHLHCQSHKTDNRHNKYVLVSHRTASEHMEEPLKPHIAAKQVPVAVGGQVDQELLHEPAVLDLKRRHIRFWYNTGDLHQALHAAVHLGTETLREREKKKKKM